MAVPKKKTSKARRNLRRAHLSHRVCANCGFYKGRTAVAVEATE
jgi:ribosomal protein L32